MNCLSCFPAAVLGLISHLALGSWPPFLVYLASGFIRFHPSFAEGHLEENALILPSSLVDGL